MIKKINHPTALHIIHTKWLTTSSWHTQSHKHIYAHVLSVCKN